MPRRFRFLEVQEELQGQAAAQFPLVMAGLAKLPTRELAEFVSFWAVWRELTPKTKARLAKLMNPDLSAEQIGLLCGRSGRTVYRLVPTPRKPANPNRPDRRSSGARWLGGSREDPEEED